MLVSSDHVFGDTQVLEGEGKTIRINFDKGRAWEALVVKNLLPMEMLILFPVSGETKRRICFF